MQFSEKTIRLLQERLESVPSELSYIFSGQTLERFVENTRVIYSLSDVQAARLSDEIVLTVLLFEPLRDLGSNIERALAIPRTVADEITSSVRDELLTAEVAELIAELNAAQLANESGEDIPVDNDELTASEEPVVPASPPAPPAAAPEPPPVPDAAPAAAPVPQAPEPHPETETHEISPLRTMQGDAERIHGYGAYRARMKEKYGTPPPNPPGGQSLADRPTYRDPDAS